MYNKKEHLQDNILAIQTAFETGSKLPSDKEKSFLRKFSGFGGLKCILRQCEKDEYLEQWPKSEQHLFGGCRQLYEVINKYSEDNDQYREYVDSMKKSVLSAFYTPYEVAQAITSSLHQSGVIPLNILEPSAGTGIFLEACRIFGHPGIVSCEKDKLTGKILQALYKDDTFVSVHIDAFESLDKDHENSYDLVISNIPFGDYRVFDAGYIDSKDKIKEQFCKTIHTYFFMKAADMVRNGGIIAFITSQGIMDTPSNKSLREWLMKRCNLLSAIRLPNNLFKEGANVEVGSDLIILQKDIGKVVLMPEELNFIETRTFGNGLSINNYFMDFSRVLHTRAVDGTNPYGCPSIEFYYDKNMQSLADNLSVMIQTDCQLNFNRKLFDDCKLLSEKEALITEQQTEENSVDDSVISLYELFGIPPEEQSQLESKKRKKVSSDTGYTTESLFSVLDDIEPAILLENTKRPRLYTENIYTFYKEDILVLDKGQIGALRFRKNRDGNPEAHFHPLDLTAKQVSIFMDYIPLRDTYLELYFYESQQQKKNDVLRYDLNEKYKLFTEKHGDLNSRSNYRMIPLDVYGKEVLGLESYFNGQKCLADIFTEPVTLLSGKRLETDDPYEALASSLNTYGYVHLDYMSSISGKSVKELKDALARQIYYNPLSGDYEYKTGFISGDVIAKADEIEKYIDENPEAEDIDPCKESLETLRKAIPVPIVFSDIQFSLGERWIPTSYYSEYASAIFNTEVSIYYLSDLDNFHIEAKDSYTVEIRQQYAVNVKDGKTRLINGITLFEHALVNTIPKITKVIGKNKLTGEDIRVPDSEAMQSANNKIESIRSGFTDWLNGKPSDVKNTLADLYNRRFNARVKPEYDGKFQTFPDLQLAPLNIEKPYDSQYDTVWMLKSNGGGIVDHEVGAGKTLTICITSHEMKRLKMVSKPIIVGLKSNTYAIAETYAKAYPNDKILYATEHDFLKKNRLKFFMKMQNNNWDAIIMTHEQFFKIPQSMDTLKDIYQSELDSVRENLRTYLQLTKGKETPKLLKGLEKRQENLEVRLKELHHKMQKQKDDMIDFRTMGIDHIFIDESHYFKNLAYNTRFYRVAGLGDPQGSQRAFNLLTAIRTIQSRNDKDLGATFLSGTTISNSLVELYLLFKYLRPKALEAQGIRTFDAWAAVYAKKTSDFEFTVTNEIKSKERFRYYKNVPELASFFMEITDYKTAKDINIERPENNVILYPTKSTPEQEEFQKILIEFAKTGNGELIDRPGVDYKSSRSGRMLVVTDLARKAALDMRLINSDKYHDHPDNKLSQAAGKIAAYYEKYKPYKGTQFVFCDLGTYKPDQWNVYSELKRKLVEDYGIASDKIRFIQEARNMNHRKELIQDLKAGKISVMVGHTTSLGTGVDAPDKAVATHNIDIPWTPKDMEQRTGRTVRKGNIVAKDYANNKVDNYVYACENSLDTYKFNLLLSKQTFIRQLKTNSLGSRTIDEGAMDEDGNMNYAEFMAIISGNTDLLDRVKLERKITYLESEQLIYRKERNTAEETLYYSQEEAKKKIRILSGLESDMEILDNQLPKGEDGKRPNPIMLYDFDKNDNAEAIGAKLLEIDKTAETSGEYTEIGTLLNFKILVKTQHSKKGSTTVSL